MKGLTADRRLEWDWYDGTIPDNVDIDESGGFRGSRRFEQQVLDALESAYDGVDRFLGLLLGGAKGALVTVLLYMFLASSMTPSSSLFAKSMTVPYLGQGAEIVRRVIHDPKIRKLYI